MCTCKFLDIERAEEYYCRAYRSESNEDWEFWNEYLSAETVEILSIEIRCAK